MTMKSSSLNIATVQDHSMMAYAISNPHALGSIDAYISAVNKLPILTAEQETELGKRLKYEQDLDAARDLVLSHLRLVVSIARQYLGYGLPHADLIQEGNIGLMKAVKRFDPDRGVRLVSFAMHWIKAEIHEYILRNWRMVKVATTKAQRKLFFNLRSLKKDGQTLDPEQIIEISDSLKVKPEEVMEMEVRLSGQDIALDMRQDDSEEDYSPINYLSDGGHYEPTQVLQRQSNDKLEGQGLVQALETLDDRSRRIIESRWLQDNGGQTLQELASEFGVSAERIRQIENKALQKMRLALTN